MPSLHSRVYLASNSVAKCYDAWRLIVNIAGRTKTGRMVKHTKGASEGLHDGCQTSHIPFLHSNRLDRDYHQRKGHTLPPPNTSLVLRVHSLPPPCVACRRRAMPWGNCCFIMSVNLKRHNNTDNILKRHKYIFKNCITFMSQISTITSFNF